MVSFSCCYANNSSKTCKRPSDGKVFQLPRKFNRKQCANVRGFTMRASCAPYQGCANQNQQGGSTPVRRAIAVLNANDNGITGQVLFTQKAHHLQINYDIDGLADGKHGFHIHEYGDLSDGCASSCSHFNPFGKKHGGLHSEERHAGDLSNIVSKGGKAKGVLQDKVLSLDFRNPACIVGRMVIVHADEDDLGLGNNDDSRVTGNAGKRLACGVIGLRK